VGAPTYGPLLENDRHIAVTDTELYWVGAGVQRAPVGGGVGETILPISWPTDYGAASIATVGGKFFIGLFGAAAPFPGKLESVVPSADGGTIETDLDRAFLHALIPSEPYLFWASGLVTAPTLIRLDTTRGADGGLSSPRPVLGPGSFDLHNLPAAHGSRLYWVAAHGRDLLTAVQDAAGAAGPTLP
jgi:hypothetical protein